MKALLKYWKLLLAFLMAVVTVFIFFMKYTPAKQAYELEKTNLTTQTTILQTQLIENQKYASVQEELEPAMEAIEASRTELYSKFPVEMKEEDQIMYMLYLEDKFGREVTFNFAQEETILPLNDGSALQGMTFTFEYETTYEGFKKMVEELATDTRITSVRYATMNYDADQDKMSGQMIVTNYLLKDGREYQAPEVDTPSIGKDNPYKK